MDVSVIVPTRNRSALLATTLRSVVRQRDVDLEVIVVDDASTDRTPEVVTALGDARVRMVRCQAPRGVSAARNLGAAEARGEWLGFVDDDDLWAPDKLARQLHAAREESRGWAYGGAVVIDARGRILRAQIPLPPDETVRALLQYDAIPGGGSNVIVRRATWQEAGPFDTRLRGGEDWEMWLRLAKRGLPACVCSPLVAKRLHDSNMTLDIEEIVRGTKLIEQLHHTRTDWGRLHRWMGHSSLRAGQTGAAIGQFARAILGGQARTVAADLGAILRERVTRPAGRTEHRRAVSDDPWIVTAAAWLQDLQHGTVGQEAGGQPS
jgi:GT2 family glycosyltransferase